MHTRMKFCVAFAAVASLMISASNATAQESLDQQLENYWTVERNLPVVQDRIYQRDGSFGLGLSVGVMSSEPFYWYIPVGARVSYWFSNHIALELGGEFTGTPGSRTPFTQKTEIHSFITERFGDSFDSDVQLEDRFLWRANAVLLWSPFYGKWAFLNNKLSHFDLNLALGGGAVSVMRPNYLRTEANPIVTGELVFGGGFAFFLSEMITLRLDGRVYVYPGADVPSTRSGYNPRDQGQVADSSNFFKRLQTPAEFLLGLHFNF